MRARPKLSSLLTRAPLEALALATLAAAVTLFTFGASVVGELQRFALDLRWLGLAAFAGAGLLLAAARTRRAAVSGWAYGLAAFLGALALVSAAWSPYPRLTLERGGTFVVALAGAGALAWAAAGRPDLVRAAVATLVALSAAIAVGGFAMLVYDREAAIQGSTSDSPARLQGIGMNPNTVSLLYALAAPLVVWLMLDSRSRLSRALAGAAAVVIAVSLFASGSRGATVASFLGVALLVLLRAGTPLRRATLVGATVAVYVVGVASSNYRSLQPEFVTAVKPRPTTPLPSGAPGEKPIAAPKHGKELAPGIVLPDVGPYSTRWRRAFPEVRGNFPYDVYAIGFERPSGLLQPAQGGIFRGSGRLSVWRGAIDDIRKRPFLGFGFGLEEQVFVDRYYAFEGSRPENSYLGWLLQLGAVGTLVFVALGLVFLRLGIRRPVGGAQAALAGAVLAGFAVSLMQSWVYSVGNLATVPFWVLCGLLAASVARPLSRSSSTQTAERPESPREKALAA